MRFFIYRVSVMAFSPKYSHNNQINARALIGQSAIWFIVPVNSWKNRASSEFVTNSSRVLQTSRVIYQPINHENLWSIA